MFVALGIKTGEDDIKLNMSDPSINIPQPSSLISFDQVRGRKVQVTLNGTYQLNGTNDQCQLISNSNGTTVLEFSCIHGLGIEINLSKVDVTSNVSNNKDSLIKIFPNPVNETLNIQADNEIAALKVLKSDGGSVDVKLCDQNKLSVANLPSGVYFLHITFKNDRNEVIKFLKK